MALFCYFLLKAYYVYAYCINGMKISNMEHLLLSRVHNIYREGLLSFSRLYLNHMHMCSVVVPIAGLATLMHCTVVQS